MEAAMVHQTAAIQKRLYRNNTGGYLGVVQLSHDGKPEGIGIEPYGTIWLSDQEAILTARAPRLPKDNPFEEQTFVVQDPATGQRRDIKMRPLALVDGEERYVPANDRYVPTEVGALPQESGPAPAADPEEAPPEAGPPSTGSQAGAPEGRPPAPAAPPVAAPAVRSQPPAEHPTAPEDAPERQSWVAEPEAPGQVLQGALGGDDTPPATPAEDLPPSEPHVPTQAPVMQATPPPEEHAAVVDPSIGEETGAAKPPTQSQPEGEFARAEEVGSPDAPTEDGPKDE